MHIYNFFITKKRKKGFTQALRTIFYGFISGCIQLVRPGVRKQRKLSAGFTLIELLIAAGIFSVITIFATGSLVIIFNSSRKTNATQAVMTNLNFALENMSREIRFGQVYRCGSGDPTVPVDCPSGNTQMSFQFDYDDDGTLEYMYYRFNGNTLERRIGSGPWQVVVSHDVRITRGRFYVLGAVSGTTQPRVLIVIAGEAGPVGTSTATNFYLQNTLTQRIYDQ